MNRILLIAHAPLAHALRSCALHVFPDCAGDVVALDVQPQTSPEESLAMARTALQQLDSRQPGDGVLVLTDMFGGSPSNIAAKLVIPGKIEAVAGVNLPMLIRALTYRDKSMQMMITKAISGGCEGVLRVPPVFTTIQNAATGS